MIWLTWRQHRAQLLITAALLLVAGTALLLHGQRVADLGAGLSGSELDDALRGQFQSGYAVLSWVPVVPGIVGMFWGAPLVAREFERGTHRLTWTQSVTRSRWLLAKLGGLALTAGAAGIALGAMIDSWLSAFAGSQFTDKIGDAALFGATGVAAGAWWVFAFTLGAASGAVARRLLPALAVTAAVFVVAMFVFFQLRGAYAEPERVIADMPPAGLVAEAAWLAPDGTETNTVLPCEDVGRSAYLDCVAESGYRSVYYTHPESRFWRFQWTEAGILLGAAVLLGGVVVYRVVRRPV